MTNVLVPLTSTLTSAWKEHAAGAGAGSVKVPDVPCTLPRCVTGGGYVVSPSCHTPVGLAAEEPELLFSAERSRRGSLLRERPPVDPLRKQL